jgi:molybdopterin converting factor small subunit
VTICTTARGANTSKLSTGVPDIQGRKGACHLWLYLAEYIEKKVDVRPRSVNVAATESMTPRAGTITVHIPGPLRNCCAGAAELPLSATSLRAVLEDLEHRYPALHRSVCDETGAVRRHVNLFVNTHHMRDRNGLDTPLAPGDEVIILPAVSGG